MSNVECQCGGTGLAGNQECVCRAGRRRKIVRIYPWMDESQIAMRLEDQESDKRLHDAVAADPTADRANRGLEPEPGE